MKATLNIENDAELRAHIKNAIKGQVTSIIRDEIIELAKGEIVRKVGNSTSLDYLIRDAVKSMVKDICSKQFNVSSWGDSFIKPCVENVVKDAIKGKDWDKLINDLAKEKVKALIQ